MDVVSLLASVVAIAASVTGVVLGVDQLTSGVRLRSLESVFRQAREIKDGHERDAVVADLHRAALGRVVAREGVPTRKFLLAIGWAAGALGAAAISGFKGEVGDKYLEAAWLLILSMMVWPAACMLTLLAAERIRLARCYRAGVAPLRAYTDIILIYVCFTRIDRLACAAAAFGACISSWAAGVFAAGFELVESGGTVTRGFTALILLSVSMSTLGLGARAITNYARSPKRHDPSKIRFLTPSWVSPDARDTD